MSIIRVSKQNNPFVQIDKRCLEDIGLTWQAKGLLAYLLSRPDNWNVRVSHLVKQSLNGRDATYNIIGELIACGYCQRTQRRDDKGIMRDVEYIISEVPLTENPDTDKPDTDKPDTENQYVNNIDSNNKEFKDIEEEEQQPNIFKLYTANIGAVQPLLVDELIEYEDKHAYTHLERAFKIAVENQARRWSYVRTILDNWEAHGYDWTPAKSSKPKPIDKVEADLDAWVKKQEALENASR